MRMEDTERDVPGAAEGQLEDLAALGIDWDGPVVSQKSRYRAHEAALSRLVGAGLVYECYCTRKDIREAASAPHAQPGRYPGTCRDLGEDERAAGRAKLAALGRRPALRLRAEGASWAVWDEVYGEVTARVDDVVLRRGDGVVAYNLAVVVDDAWAGVDQVCRGDDLLASAPSQSFIAHVLDLPQPTYVHVPLVVNAAGRRLAKRDGAVTLRDLRGLGWSPTDVIRVIGESVGVPGARRAADVRDGLDLAWFRRRAGRPWVFTPPSAP